MEFVSGQEQSQEPAVNNVVPTEDDIFKELLPQEQQTQLQPQQGIQQTQLPQQETLLQTQPQQQTQPQLTPQQQQVLNEMFSFSVGQDRFEAEGRHVPLELRSKLLEYAENLNTNYNQRINRFQELTNLQEQDVYMRGRGMWLQQETNNLQNFIASPNFQQMLQNEDQKENVQAIYSRLNQVQSEYQQIVSNIQQQQQQLQYHQQMQYNDLMNSSQMAIERRIPNFKVQHLDKVAQYLYDNYRDSDEKIDMGELRNQIMGNEVLAALAFKASRYDEIINSRKLPKPINGNSTSTINTENTNPGSGDERMVDKEIVMKRLREQGLL